MTPATVEPLLPMKAALNWRSRRNGRKESFGAARGRRWWWRRSGVNSYSLRSFPFNPLQKISGPSWLHALRGKRRGGSGRPHVSATRTTASTTHGNWGGAANFFHQTRGTCGQTWSIAIARGYLVRRASSLVNIRLSLQRMAWQLEGTKHHNWHHFLWSYFLSTQRRSSISCPHVSEVCAIKIHASLVLGVSWSLSPSLCYSDASITFWAVLLFTRNFNTSLSRAFQVGFSAWLWWPTSIGGVS
jgi:hypothetical protein